MGTITATLPDGVKVERDLSRPGRYSHGLVIRRGNKWILVSVHSSPEMAHKNRRRLQRCFVGGQGFDDYPEMDVVPLGRTSADLVPKRQGFDVAHPQPSSIVNLSTST